MVPSKGNKLIDKFLIELDKNEEIKTMWEIMNVNAINRRGMTDHGPVHFKIVSNIALKLTRLITESGTKLSIQKDFGLSQDYGELVILLASVMHDLGMTIERSGHEEFSVVLANNLLRESLHFLPIKEKTIIIAETLHAIISHRSGGTPHTLEAGIVRVADALDMSKGRSRIPYEAGSTSIHSISAAAIENISIEKGKNKPIQIEILMNNSSGVFQIDELLKKKIKGSGIEDYIAVHAYLEGKSEKNLLQEFTI